MKTAIIQLEAHDDLTSIRDKISWSKSQRIILVFPKKLKYIPEVLDLRLIQRSARANGSSIALVTRERRVIENADEVGIPVFSSIPQAEKATWKGGTLTNGEKGHAKGIEQILLKRIEIEEQIQPDKLNPIIRTILFLSALAAIVLMTGYILPAAQVNVLPVVRNQEYTVDITASTEIKEASITGLIPADEKKFTLTMEKTANSTGTAILPQTKASGIINVKNLTASEVVLPAGIIFSTDEENPVRFTSKNEVVLAPGAAGIEIKTEALLPGAKGNVESGQVNEVEGVYRTMIEASNLEPFTGGSELTVPSPTEEDYHKLGELIKSDLDDLAREEVKNQQTESEKAITESLNLDEIILKIQSNPVGEPSDTLTMTMKVQYSVITYNPQDVTGLINQIFDAGILKIVHTVDEEVSIVELHKPTQTAENTYKWQVRGTRWIADDWDQDLARKLIKGKRVEEAVKIIEEQFPNIQSLEVDLTPRFWRRMPYLPGRIIFQEVFNP
jgi:hypothetical protein